MQDRTKKTLMNLISEHVKRGTTIISDCWKEYDIRQLTNAGYTHLIVNHFKFFGNLNIGVHTKSIEGTWMHVKRYLNKNGTTKELLPNYFAKFM
jgi:hypothetical protein